MFAGRTALVTGAGQGIGRAIAEALAQEGMRVAVVDLDPATARETADRIGGIALTADLRHADQVADMIGRAKAALGPIDMLVSNAGFARGALDGPASASDRQWQDSWDLHVMAHLRAARVLLPEMRARRSGWLVNIASAAGLLSQIGDAPYSASKHAAVSLAQSLAIEHGDDGVHVAVVCPLFVATSLLGYGPDPRENTLPNDRVLAPADVADALVDGLKAGHFLILPHPEAAAFFRRRATDMDRWIAGMRRLRREALSEGPVTSFEEWHRRI